MKQKLLLCGAAVYDMAKTALDKALQNADEDDFAFLQLAAQICKSNGEYQVALSHINKALLIAPDLAELYLTNELLECFQWSDDGYDLEHVKEELADVIVYCVDMLDKLGLDVDEIVNAKMSKNEAKYPVEKAKGSAAKYDRL